MRVQFQSNKALYLTVLFLTPTREVAFYFPSLPHLKAQSKNIFSRIKMFPNRSQEKIQQNEAERKPATTGLGIVSEAKWLRFWDTPPEVSAGLWMPSRGRKMLHFPRSRFWHRNSGAGCWDSKHFSAFTFIGNANSVESVIICSYVFFKPTSNSS